MQTHAVKVQFTQLTKTFFNLLLGGSRQRKEKSCTVNKEYFCLNEHGLLNIADTFIDCIDHSINTLLLPV